MLGRFFGCFCGRFFLSFACRVGWLVSVRLFVCSFVCLFVLHVVRFSCVISCTHDMRVHFFCYVCFFGWLCTFPPIEIN